MLTAAESGGVWKSGLLAVVLAAASGGWLPARAQEGADAGSQDPAPAERAKFDPAMLVGEWRVTSGQRQGAKVEADRLPPAIVFAKDRLTIPVGPDSDEVFVIGYKVNASGDPVEVDFQILEGPAPDASALGILKWDGSELTLCYDPTGQTRPDKFETSEENGRFLFVLKKNAEKFDPAQMVGTWLYASGSKAGEELPAERMAGEVKITDADITLPAGPDATFVMSYKVDASHAPAWIDMRIESGPAAEGSEARGLIGFEGDELVLCYDPFGQKRPERVEANEDNGCFLFRLKRKPK